LGGGQDARLVGSDSDVEFQESCIHPMFTHTALARPILRGCPVLPRQD
jgi:hypothetical protein